MRQFLKFTLASMTGFLIAMLLFIVIIVMMISSSISSFKDDQTVDVNDNSVLELKLNNPITERTDNNPLDNLGIGFGSKKETGLNDILKCIKKAEIDSRINGILLHLSSVNGGIASVKEIRDALLAYKKSGKFLYAYSDSYSQAGYYLASCADSIFIQPEGSVDFHGLSANLMFLKGTLEKLEIEPEIIRHGKFKSAVEPFINDKMSKENREQTQVFVGSIWTSMLNDISASRKISSDELQKLADQLEGRSAETAVNARLVDRIAYYDNVLTSIRKKTKQEENEKVRTVELSNYSKTYVKMSKTGAGKIAVIYAFGEIVSGKGDDDNIGSDRISEAIRKARMDSSIRAIVFRVNSPGGSAIASDVILREAKLAKAAKPFIVSMGDYAASGGYYISCAADTIVAEPTTITGSIGVFGLLFNTQKLMNNKLGITFDTVRTARMADIGSPTRKMTEQERAVIQSEVERIYDTFLGHVANGRGMTKAEVDSIGQGRVWSGTDALRLGLVDVIGGIDDAIAIAARKANLTDYRTIELPEQKEFFEKLMEDFNDQASVKIAREQYGDLYDAYTGIRSILKQKGILARIPFSLQLN
jgi:protease IV